MDLKNNNKLRWLILGLLIAGATSLLIACGGGGGGGGGAGTPKEGTWLGTVKPLFTTANSFHSSHQACSSCHNGLEGAHQLDLGTYWGVMSGADVKEQPPGVDILGRDVTCVGKSADMAANTCVPDWDKSKLKARLRNTRMPPGWSFDIAEGNRDTLEIGVIATWMLHGGKDGKPTDGTVGYGSLLTDLKLCTLKDSGGVTLDEMIIDTNTVSVCSVPAGSPTDATVGTPAALTNFWVTAPAAADTVGSLLTRANTFHTSADGTGHMACNGCHSGVDGAHQLDLSTYAGIFNGADSVEAPPGTDILGRDATCVGKLPDFTGNTCLPAWGKSKMRERLRNSRMPPGWGDDGTAYSEKTANRDSAEILKVEAWVTAGALP